MENIQCLDHERYILTKYCDMLFYYITIVCERFYRQYHFSTTNKLMALVGLPSDPTVKFGLWTMISHNLINRGWKLLNVFFTCPKKKKELDV